MSYRVFGLHAAQCFCCCMSPGRATGGPFTHLLQRICKKTMGTSLPCLFDLYLVKVLQYNLAD